MQVGLMRTLDIWLAEDHSRVENRLCQREAVGQLIEVYTRLCRGATARSPVMPQMLDSLKVMLGRWVQEAGDRRNKAAAGPKAQLALFSSLMWLARSH
jgi:hypothetical protein